MTRAASLLAAPSGKTLALLASLVLAIHAVLLVYTGPSFFRFEPNPLTVAALQTRLISAAAADPAAPAHEPRAISNAKPKAQTPRKAPVAARQGVSQGTLAQTPSDASEPSPPGDSQTHTSLPPKEEAVPAVPSPTTPTSTATPSTATSLTTPTSTSNHKVVNNKLRIKRHSHTCRASRSHRVDVESTRSRQR